MAIEYGTKQIRIFSQCCFWELQLLHSHILDRPASFFQKYIRLLPKSPFFHHQSGIYLSKGKYKNFAVIWM